MSNSKTADLARRHEEFPERALTPGGGLVEERLVLQQRQLELQDLRTHAVAGRAQLVQRRRDPRHERARRRRRLAALALQDLGRLAEVGQRPGADLEDLHGGGCQWCRPAPTNQA